MLLSTISRVHNNIHKKNIEKKTTTTTSQKKNKNKNKKQKTKNEKNFSYIMNRFIYIDVF